MHIQYSLNLIISTQKKHQSMIKENLENHGYGTSSMRKRTYLIFIYLFIHYKRCNSISG